MSLLPHAIVDAHHHLWRLDQGHYPWLQEGYDPARFILGDYASLCRDFGPTDYLSATQAQPVVAMVHVEAERDRTEAVAETRWLQAQHDEHGFPHAIVAWVDLLADDAEQRLAEQIAHPLVRGVRCKPRTSATADEPVAHLPGALQDPRWLPALQRLQRHGLAWDLRVPFWHLEDAAALISQLPGLAVVLEHTGLPWDRSEQGLAHWRRGMQTLARCEQVHVKLSEFGLKDAPWRFEGNARIVREAVEIFGARRCMFGSNFPVASLRIDFRTLVQAMSGALAHLPPQARQGIWHDNALRFYRIHGQPGSPEESTT